MLTVLIVEDDLTIADLLQEALEIDGYHITGIARTVAEAIRLNEQHPADAAVIDIRLANGEMGTDVGLFLRERSHTKVMFSTGNANDLNLMQNCGDAVMTKPYRLGDVTRGLKILDDIARFGSTALAFPRNFRLLDLAAA